MTNNQNLSQNEDDRGIPWKIIGPIGLLLVLIVGIALFIPENTGNGEMESDKNNSSGEMDRRSGQVKGNSQEKTTGSEPSYSKKFMDWVAARLTHACNNDVEKEGKLENEGGIVGAFRLGQVPSSSHRLKEICNRLVEELRLHRIPGTEVTVEPTLSGADVMAEVTIHGASGTLILSIPDQNRSVEADFTYSPGSTFPP